MHKLMALLIILYLGMTYICYRLSVTINMHMLEINLNMRNVRNLEFVV